MEKLLPQNIEAECGVLGSILIDPEAIVGVADFLRPHDFYRDAHRVIYDAASDLLEQGEPADFITLCDELERRGTLDDAGGASYITSLINQVPSSGNVEYYGRIVERASILRQLILAAGQIAATAYDADDAEKALDRAESLIARIRQGRTVHEGLTDLKDILAACVDDITCACEHQDEAMGVPTGFTELDDMLGGGLQRADLILLAARPGMGKCLPFWTLIDNPETGERVTIEQYVSSQCSQIHGLSDTGHVRITHATNWIENGIKPCFKVRTRLGRTIDATGTHPFLTIRGWTPLHDLAVGRYIAVPTKVECFGHDNSVSLERIRLLAYFIAEGNLTNSCPRFTNTDPSIVADFKQCIMSQFPACTVNQCGITYSVPQQKHSQKNPVTAWLKELGVYGKRAEAKTFPSCVWTWSRERLAEFLRILMSCDGCIYSFQGRPVIEFTVASERLAMDVHHAFVRFGIIAKLCRKTAKAWRVEITSPESIKCYQEEIGWLGEKEQRFTGYVHLVTLRGGNNGHAPKETWELVQVAISKQRLSMIEVARRSGETVQTGHDAGYSSHKNRSIPRYRLAGYAEVLDDDALRIIASPDIYWDEIVSIEPIGEHQVYDLTVPDGSNFIAQDVIVHNSALSLNMARYAAGKGKRSAIFSLEMGKKQLGFRLLAYETGIATQRMRNAWLSDADRVAIVGAQGRLEELPLSIDDTSGSPLTYIRNELKRKQAETGKPVDLVIVDYLQMMEPPRDEREHRGYENRVQALDKIAYGLKGLAKDFNIPVVALAQLSRKVEERPVKIPQMADLRESGGLEAAADIILFIYRDEVYAGKNPDGSSRSEHPGMADILIAKYRNGEASDGTKLYWSGRQTRFFNSKEEYENAYNL